MILMQEGTEDIEPTAEWADHVYEAYEMLGATLKHLDRAELWS